MTNSPVSVAAKYTATFTTQYQVTTMAGPSGGGTATPTGASNYYAAGTKVTLVATAKPGYEFSS